LTSFARKEISGSDAVCWGPFIWQEEPLNIARKTTSKFHT